MQHCNKYKSNKYIPQCIYQLYKNKISSILIYFYKWQLIEKTLCKLMFTKTYIIIENCL